jgi:predicted  nucleic acid-binding Zn-ribbon protein
MTDDELKGLFDALRQENVASREENAAAHAGTRRQFAEVAARIATENQHFFAAGAEALRHEIQLIAESVTGTREALNREAAGIREEVRRTATETQAMIKFSHAELDRRISSLERTQNRLEDALTELQTRVERLEGSTY